MLMILNGLLSAFSFQGNGWFALSQTLTSLTNISVKTLTHATNKIAMTITFWGVDQNLKMSTMRNWLEKILI